MVIGYQPKNEYPCNVVSCFTVETVSDVCEDVSDSQQWGAWIALLRRQKHASSGLFPGFTLAIKFNATLIESLLVFQALREMLDREKPDGTWKNRFYI